ncbi:hypothetical protein F0562_014617 [Nyssa sinensis]|uniref:MADS-box domain-containing protein n=1 Tax=Nyssa sinensis TaxID=561372 RepID=A0A5J4ZTD9_9ASTE|nr:hypothetical protein F0562_014617 [Nyssa sinensis]
MTRKKVRLHYIPNDSARKATFKKRKKGLMKKVNELTTLCGVDACAIVFSPFDPEPDVWPSPLGVQRVLARFRKMPEVEQSRKMVNQESYIKQRIMKAEEQLRRQQKDNRIKEMTQVMYQCLNGEGPQNLNLVDLNHLGWLINQNINEMGRRMEALKKEPPPQLMLAVDQKTSERFGENGMEMRMASDQFIMNPIQDYQWYMDLLKPPPNVQFGWDEIMMPHVYNHNASHR